MAQVFSPYSNLVARLTLVATLGGLVMLAWAWWRLDHSSYNTGQGVVRQQPVPFSHKHHAGDDGIDCRYCHTSVETEAFAGMPPTRTCLNCHRQLWAQSGMLAPVLRSGASGVPIQWTRVHDLPDFVYFRHDVHIHKGIGCTTCHGRVDQMPLVYAAQRLQMGWCLDCHRHPERHVRPGDQVFNMAWQVPANQEAQGRRLVTAYQIRGPQALTGCYTCHR